MKNNIWRFLAKSLCVCCILAAAFLLQFSLAEKTDAAPVLFTKADAATYSGHCGDDISWSLSVSTGELNITGSGKMYSYDENFEDYSAEDFEEYTPLAPWYSYRKYIKIVNIDNGITSIGSEAFLRCNNLTSISIPNSVKEIEDRAFSGCSALKSINIPKKLISIGNSTFKGCSKLTSIELPDSLSYIGTGAFSGCSKLTDIKIPNGVTGIWYETFSGCSSLKSVVLPDSLTLIGGSAFSGCNSLTSINIPNKVTSIGGYAFKECRKLTSIKLPNSMQIINEYTFSGFSGLKSIEIPDSVILIQNDAFSGCKKLTNVYYNGTNTAWNGITVKRGNESLSNAKIYFSRADTSTYSGQCGKNVFWALNTATGVLNITGSGKMDSYVASFDDINEYISSVPWYLYRKHIKTVNIDNGITSIPNGAFLHCINLTSIDIPDSVTSIGYWAFFDCSSLKNVKLSNSITKIDDWTFLGCKSLTSIVIPDGVKSIGQVAFSACSSLTGIVIPNSVTSIEYAAINNSCENLSDIYYSGTVQEWAKISIGRENHSLYTATIHYNSKTKIEIPVLSNIKKSANKSQVIVTDAVRVSDMLSEFTYGVVITKADGVTPVYSNAYIGTGMKLILKNEKGVIFDEKTVIVPCDIDGDGKVSAADARSALRNSVGLEAFDEAQNKAANADNSNDSKIKASDARIILRAAVGLENKKSIFDKTA